MSRLANGLLAVLLLLGAGPALAGLGGASAPNVRLAAIIGGPFAPQPSRVWYSKGIASVEHRSAGEWCIKPSFSVDVKKVVPVVSVDQSRSTGAIARWSSTARTIPDARMLSLSRRSSRTWNPARRHAACSSPATMSRSRSSSPNPTRSRAFDRPPASPQSGSSIPHPATPPTPRRTSGRRGAPHPCSPRQEGPVPARQRRLWEAPCSALNALPRPHGRRRPCAQARRRDPSPR
jgi:hypothetical protein